jgi:phosphatidylglycerol:prolipoprotein diacylglycerol transferase
MFFALPFPMIDPVLVQIGPFAIRWYALAYIAGIVLGWRLARRLVVLGPKVATPEQVDDFVTWVTLGIILGGRFGYLIFYRPDIFLRAPWEILYLWQGGMSFHGGALGVIVALYFFTRRQGLDWVAFSDRVVCVVPIGIFLGRLANFINGELYGRATSVPWAVQFPKELYDAPPETAREVLLEASQIDPAFTNIPAVVENAGASPELHTLLGNVLTPRHPSQIYEAFLEGAVLFAILWILRTRFRLPDGILTGVFFIAYALLRIAGEFFREPDAPLTLMLTRGQFLSLFLILIGVAFLVAARIRPTWAPKFRA